MDALVPAQVELPREAEDALVALQVSATWRQRRTLCGREAIFARSSGETCASKDEDRPDGAAGLDVLATGASASAREAALPRPPGPY